VNRDGAVANIANQVAVVIGAGMGGLAAAGALSDFFGRVIVLDRDKLPSEGVPRSGVPQGAHTHGLLVGGRGSGDYGRYRCCFRASTRISEQPAR
jgi:glycine/D-amino acid oxidase-like deaminating enzyme